MNDRQAFIATIAANLREADELEQRAELTQRIGTEFNFRDKVKQLRTNTDAHLVYADWLEEQGDPLAELIRVSCQFTQHRWMRNIVERDYDARDGVDAEWQYGFDLCDRMQTLQQQLNPFSDSVKVTWDRGLIVGMEIAREDYVVGGGPFIEMPICTLRLRDWHGIERSLPKNPAEALPWLFKLELPHDLVGREGTHVRDYDRLESTSLDDIVEAFGTLPNGKPRVRVEFTERFNAEWNSREV